MLKLSPESVTGRRSNGRVAKGNSPLHDKQSERDHRDLPIDKVDVRGLRFPIQIRDKAHSLQNTIATIGMFVDLPKEFKGTHMSRFKKGSVPKNRIFSCLIECHRHHG